MGILLVNYVFYKYKYINRIACLNDFLEEQYYNELFIASDKGLLFYDNLLNY